MADIGNNHAFANAFTEAAAPCDVVELPEGKLSADGEVIPPPPLMVVSAGEGPVAAVFDLVTVTVATLAGETEVSATAPSNQFPSGMVT